MGILASRTESLGCLKSYKNSAESRKRHFELEPIIFYVCLGTAPHCTNIRHSHEQTKREPATYATNFGRLFRGKITIGLTVRFKLSTRVLSIQNPCSAPYHPC